VRAPPPVSTLRNGVVPIFDDRLPSNSIIGLSLGSV